MKSLGGIAPIDARCCAALHAAQPLMLACGDIDGKVTWLAILRAIEELRRTERGGGEVDTRSGAQL